LQRMDFWCVSKRVCHVFVLHYMEAKIQFRREEDNKIKNRPMP
jgi:hypothetical protein